MKTTETDRKRSSQKITLILMAIALLLLLLLQWKLGKYSQAHSASTPAMPERPDTLLVEPDSIADSQSISLDSLAQMISTSRSSDTLRIRRAHASGHWNSPVHNQEPDSTRHKDSIEQKAISQDSLPRAADQSPPEGQILPPPGRYFHPIALRFSCAEKNCSARIATEDTAQPAPWKEAIPWNRSGRVWWQLEDSVGNKTPWFAADYDMASDNRCGANAYPVPVGNKQVCVDAYEYPNQPEALPKDMVNWEEADRLCRQAGKHLCSLEEWQAACQGKDQWLYPYGNRYNETLCATAQNRPERSGRKEGCRSWWGMSDMSGNLWEWTSTPHQDRPGFYLVAGGSWNTAVASSCRETKFSFYPQNQYPFVGFRCCSAMP